MVSGLIVGIDPGTTTAIAILDLKGNFVALKSRKDFTQKDVQEFIQSYGQPSVVASDVTKPAELVDKIAAGFSIEKFIPKRDTPRLEKLGVGKYFKVEVKNWHERSALAAAFFAYKSRENKLRQIERQMKERGFGDRIEEVKKGVIKGRSVARVLEGRP